MIFASWWETRSMNSVRVSRSAKPSDSSTTVTRPARRPCRARRAAGRARGGRPAAGPAAGSAGRAPGAACAGRRRARGACRRGSSAASAGAPRACAMSVCSVLISRLAEMSVVSTRSLALWPPISDWLRSIFLWIWPGADPPTSRPGARTRARRGGSRQDGSVRRNRMRPSMLGDRPAASARFPAWCRTFTGR